MGSDKALLQLAGKPLIAHAVRKLQRICADVRVLSSNPELAQYAPLVSDFHSGIGPLAGIEAALAHSACDWNLFLPVDMPFLPSALISGWVTLWLEEENRGARICMFTVDGRPQPGFCLLHKDLLPFLSKAIERGEFKLMTVFQEAGRELALRRGYPPDRYPPDTGLWNVSASDLRITRHALNLEDCPPISEAQQEAQALWFTNLNTPQDFAFAQRHLNALDT
jgi:molybdopterin-guanine dinucleotide biosynthesis protein A